MIIVRVMLHLSLFARQDSVSAHRISQSFQCPQVMDGLGRHLPKYHILEIKEGARGKGDDESTVVGVFLTHTAQQSRPIVGQLERLIPKVRTKNRTISTFEVAELHKCSWDYLLEMVSDERQMPALVVGSSQEKSLEVFRGARDGVLEELSGFGVTRKCRSKRGPLSLPRLTSMIGFCLRWIS